jgi:hypothetical protein
MVIVSSPSSKDSVARYGKNRFSAAKIVRDPLLTAVGEKKESLERERRTQGRGAELRM